MKGNGKNKVLLLGWDAADWKVINPLVDQGLMPNMKKLIEGGTIANLATLDPPYSPMLWSSIATGKRPYKHGVLGFTEITPDGKDVRPVMSISRKCKALWNIFNQNKMRSHVVGWWPSHPAEPINGIMVSNFYQQHTGHINQPWPMPSGTIHPKVEEKLYSFLRVHPQELNSEHILPFIPNMGKINQKKDPRVFSVAKVTAHASSLHAAFTNAIRTQPWDFAALYLDAIDHYCHGFMKYHPPKRPHIIQEDYDLYKNVVTAGYQFHDLMLGRIMELVDDQTTILLISDHGFQPDHLRPDKIPNEPAGPAYEHSDYGILVAYGPNIKKDNISYGASVIDIAPTILALHSLPIAEDMDGRVLTSIFETPPEIKLIPSWESVNGDSGQIKNWNSEEKENTSKAVLKQLEDLGYIDSLPKSQEGKIEMTRNECNFNLARAYIDGSKIEEAVPLLEQLRKVDPRAIRYSFKLASCYQMLGRLSDARAIIDEIREKEVYNSPALDMMEGSLLLGEKKPKLAIDCFKAAQGKVNAHHSRINFQFANAYLMLNRWSDAKEYLNKEIDIDYDNAAAHALLGRTFLFENKYEEACDSYLTAIGLDFNKHNYHHALGTALFKIGKYHEAVHALENSLKLAPDNNPCRELLIKIYGNHLHDTKNYNLHRSKLKIHKKGLIYVVSGLPRSGTSMMMQMLKEGGLELFTDGKRETDENNPKGYYEHEAVKSLSRNRKWLIQAEGKGIKIISHLLKHLPSNFDYKVIFMERNISEVLASQGKMLSRLEKKVDNSVYPTALEKKYREDINDTKEFLANQHNFKVLYINHHDILKSPFSSALEVAEFVDQNLIVEKMSNIVDPALHREKMVLN